MHPEVLHRQLNMLQIHSGNQNTWLAWRVHVIGCAPYKPLPCVTYLYCTCAHRMYRESRWFPDITSHKPQKNTLSLFLIGYYTIYPIVTCSLCGLYVEIYYGVAHTMYAKIQGFLKGKCSFGTKWIYYGISTFCGTVHIICMCWAPLTDSEHITMATVLYHTAAEYSHITS